MVPVCDKRYHIYNRFCHFWAEIKKLWNYPLEDLLANVEAIYPIEHQVSALASDLSMELR